MRKIIPITNPRSRAYYPLETTAKECERMAMLRRGVAHWQRQHEPDQAEATEAEAAALELAADIARAEFKKLTAQS